ncbi:MAG: hypothetical protein HYX27_05395 [Acidobacteria bacterium]|nr:hypothetical protein [Acidobacteriota bacterium]
MLILFDHGTPRGLAQAFVGHTVLTAYAKGWDRLTNGALRKAAEEEAIDIVLTTDRRLRYLQNLKGRTISIVVLTGTTKWSRVRSHIQRIVAAVEGSTPGGYVEIDIPFKLLGD